MTVFLKPNRPIITQLYLIDNLNFISKKTMLTSVQRGTSSMELAKETFIQFCEHFNKIAFNALAKDHIVIKFFAETINKKDYLCNRAFQLALDVTYAKREFNREHVLEHFNAYFSIKNILDPYDKTSAIDQSTLFTVLQSKLVKQKHPQWEIEVNQTPATNVSLKDLSESLQDILNYNKELTGNRYPDVGINGVPYDYKSTKDIFNTKNQIYLMPESLKAKAALEAIIGNYPDRVQQSIYQATKGTLGHIFNTDAID
jgi:hypothetical protein